MSKKSSSPLSPLSAFSSGTYTMHNDSQLATNSFFSQFSFSLKKMEETCVGM